MRRIFIVYALTLVGFGWGIYLTLEAGARLEQTPRTVGAGAGAVVATLGDSFHDPLSLLLVQLILIVLLARVFGSNFARLGQPAVIGEMLAGIALGAVAFGRVASTAFVSSFRRPRMGRCGFSARVGVILFMFVGGPWSLERVRRLRDRANAAILVSHVSIVFPYFLGVLASYFLYQTFSDGTTSFIAFACSWGSP
jgi:Kef-type K+ transport system membrane component KefB